MIRGAAPGGHCAIKVRKKIFLTLTARFTASDAPDLDLLQRWILESYKAIAPKRLSAGA